MCLRLAEIALAILTLTLYDVHLALYVTHRVTTFRYCVVAVLAHARLNTYIVERRLFKPRAATCESRRNTASELFKFWRTWLWFKLFQLPFHPISRMHHVYVTAAVAVMLSAPIPAVISGVVDVFILLFNHCHPDPKILDTAQSLQLIQVLQSCKHNLFRRLLNLSRQEHLV